MRQYIALRFPQQGYALVIVLWLVTLLSLVVGIAYNMARTEARISSFTRTETSGNALTEAGIWLAINKLLEQENSRIGLPREETIEYRDYNMAISITDLASRINVNNADPALLMRLLSTASIDESQAIRLVQNIRDWIDSDDDTADYPSETAYYQQQNLSYAPKNRRFSVLSELRLVAGMNDSLYRQIAPYLTVLGQHRQVNIDSAKPDLINLITGEEESRDDNPTAFPGRRYTTDAGSGAFIINSRITIDGISVENTAIVELTGRQRANAYRILAWYKNNDIRKDGPDA